MKKPIINIHIGTLIEKLEINTNEAKPNAEDIKKQVYNTLMESIKNMDFKINFQDNANNPKDCKNRLGYPKSTFVGPPPLRPKL